MVRADFVVNEGAGEVAARRAARLRSVRGREGVFRFTVDTTGAAAASTPRIGDNALLKLAPHLSALASARPEPVRQPELDELLAALGLDPADPGAVIELEADSPELAVLLEPMVGVTLTPTMISASEKINGCRRTPGSRSTAGCRRAG